MSEPKISVIIPVYNVEPYLEKCVNSVCEQTHSNLEIILVDDGSPDNCPALCESLAQRDPRLRVIHKENGGVSSARNAGLDIATGDYIGFVDADDYIEPEMYRRLLATLEENRADVAICGYKRVDEEGKVLSTVGVSEMKCLSHAEGLALMRYERIRKRPEEITLHDLFFGSCNKLYRRNVLKAARFDETLSIGEDGLFFAQALLNCEKTVACLGAPYFYVQYARSTTHTMDAKRAGDAYRSVREMAAALERKAARYPEVEDALLSQLIVSAFAYINLLAGLGEKGRFWEVRKELMDRSADVKKYRSEYSLKFRGGLFLLRRFPRCYWLITRLRWGRK